MLPKPLYDKFETLGLDVEVSLNWVLGYARNEFVRQMDLSILVFSFNESVTIDISDDLVQQLKLHAHPTVSLNEIAYLFCLLAFALGGSE